MKKKFYNVGQLLYNRNQKLGVETLIGIGIATAAVSAGVGVAEAEANRSAAESANATNAALSEKSLEQQKELFREGNIFNAEQAQIARDYNSKEAQINREWEESMTDKQMEKAMDWFEKYSSPASQYKQYLDAGLNPATLAGNTNGFTPSFSLPSASAASSSPASSGSIPSASVFPQQPVTSNFGGVIKDALDNVNNIFSMSKTKAETEGIVTDTQWKGILNAADLDVKDATSKKMLSDVNYNNAKIAETNKNLDLIAKNIDYLDKKGQNVDADTAIKNMELFYKSAEYEGILKKMEQDYHISRQLADAQLKLYGSQILKNRADAASAAAYASFLNAQEKIIIPEERRQIQNYANYLGQQTGIATTKNFLDMMFGMEEREQGIKIGNEQYEQARYHNTLFFRMLNAGREVSSSVGNGFLMYYGAKGLH